MSLTVKFGTDGWRAIIAQDFTFDNVRLCAQGVAEHLKDRGTTSRGLIIGYDTRFASEHFAAAAAEVVAANGIKAYLCPHPTPTPVVSYGVQQKKTAGAIIITASHNPALYSGFKVKSEQGMSAPAEITADIEKRLPGILSQNRVRQIPLAQGAKEGLIEYPDLMPAYLHRLTELVDLASLRRSHLKVVVDCMYGAGSGYFPALLQSGTLSLQEIHQERNPLFPGLDPEPIARNLTELATRVKAEKANAGLATDGDADRIGVIDEKGNFITQLQVFSLLALYFLEVRGERGAIVKTVTTSTMLDRLGKIFQVPVYETAVGFNHVASQMIAENALIGGEESGGYGFRGHVPERDGILAGLCFLDLMLRLKKTPSELVQYLYSKVGPHYYDRVDIAFPATSREDILSRFVHYQPESIIGLKVGSKDTIDGFRFFLKDGSWLLVRFSGTEPLIRVYAESDTMDKVRGLLAEGKKVASI